MLKIYLDWNSINNIQTRHPKLYELIKEYGHLFIFPYSNAHIRDLLVSKDENNPFYRRDIATLTEICGKHLLQFEDENNLVFPWKLFRRRTGFPSKSFDNLKKVLGRVSQKISKRGYKGQILMRCL